MDILNDGFFYVFAYFASISSLAAQSLRVASIRSKTRVRELLPERANSSRPLRLDPSASIDRGRRSDREVPGRSQAPLPVRRRQIELDSERTACRESSEDRERETARSLVGVRDRWPSPTVRASSRDRYRNPERSGNF